MSSSAGYRPGMLGRRPREDEEDHTSGARRPRKKQRLEEFERGSIIKVAVKNFMTYVSAVIEVGPRLNLVLGPNGTGKSSLVCALCVGLAGATKLLGRADDLAEYVRRGEQEGFVEITISSGDPQVPIVISRRLHKQDNSSEWKVNGRPSKMADVKMIVKELNVQLDNLCQFLPQDRVSFFARLSPQQLLVETEKAIGDSTLHDLHTELIQESRKLSGLEVAAGLLESKLQQLRKENEAIQRDVTRFQTRETLMVKIEECKAKMAWMAFQASVDSYKELKILYQEKAKTLRTREVEGERQRGPLEELRKKAGELAKEAKAVLDKSIKADKDIYDLLTNDHPKLAKDIEEKVFALSSMEEAAAKRELDISRLTGLVQMLQQEFDSLPATQASQPDTRERQSELRRIMNDADAEIRQLKNNQDDVSQNQGSIMAEKQQLEGQVQQLDNVKSQRLTRLNNENPGIRALTEWVWANAPKFRGKVYGPLLLDINIPDPEHAKYLEQICRRDLWSRFLTEFPEDQQLLSQHARSSNFRPTVSCYRGDATQPIAKRFGPASQYSRYGITHTLDEVFEAPDIMKHVLNDEANVSSVYVGSASTNTERLFHEQPQLVTVCVPDAMYRVTKSQYNPHQKSTSVSEWREPRILTSSATDVETQRGRLVAHIDTLKQQLDAIEAEKQALVSESRNQQEAKRNAEEELRRLKEEAVAFTNKRNKAQRDLNIKKKMLAAEEKKPDPLLKKPQTERELQQLRDKMEKLVLSLPGRLRAFWDLQKAHLVKDLELKEMHLLITSAGKASKAYEREIATLKEEAAHAKAEMEKKKTLARTLKEDALGMTGDVDVSVSNNSANPAAKVWSDKFQKLPDRIQQLQELIETTQLEAEGIVCTNPRVMEEYKERMEKIRKTEGELEKEAETLELARAETADKKARWEPELRKIVQVINRSFGQNMAEMGCAGSVELAPNDTDFAAWSLQLRVKYRDEEDLQLLTSSRQSGGERSVATILYLIAIQAVTACPFRVVDEINQGMDPINERKVFQQLVEAACRPGTPQCFLLTPKLLPNLPFSPHVEVLQIMNGPLIKEVATTFTKGTVCGKRTRMEKVVLLPMAA